MMIALLGQWFRIAHQIVRIFFTEHMEDIVAMTAIVGVVMLMLLGEVMIM